MSKTSRTGRPGTSIIRAPLGILTFMLVAFASSPAFAGSPAHLRTPALDISGLNHACGVAVDSKGDVYASSAGDAKVKVFDPAHTELTSIPNANEPCGLAVNSKGELFVSEKGTGKVVRYKPNAYPFVGTPTYGAAEPIDSSGSAKGIAVDPFDGRLYVAEGNHVAVYKADGSFEANVGEGDLTNATGVAAYTYDGSGKDRHLYVADDAASDRVMVFSGPSAGGLKLRSEITGPKTGEDFGFDTAGTYLAVDPGNRGAGGKCASVAEQACSAGHLLVYDAAHNVVDEFDATGEFLDQLPNAALAAAKPTALAIERSGGAGDGTIYVSGGDAAAAKVLAFGPLAAPSRSPVPELSHELKKASAVATDSYGNVYVIAGALIHVFDPSGKEIKVGPAGKGVEDPNQPDEISVDSEGRVYVLDQFGGVPGEAEATYYTPSVYPPIDGTAYVRREPPVSTATDWPAACMIVTSLVAIPSNDHVILSGCEENHELDSAAPGHDSALLNGDFADLGAGAPESVAAYGSNGSVYFGRNPGRIAVVNQAGTEILASINGAGSPSGGFGGNPYLAVDQSNGHVLEFSNQTTAHEYDASGAFVAQFGSFTAGGLKGSIAIDNACALHRNALDELEPLTESTIPTCKQFDPANGTVYVAFDDAAPKTFDLTAFSPLSYGESPLATTGIASDISTGNATLNGAVNPRGFELTACRFEYLTDAKYLENGKTFAGATAVPCAETLAGIGKGSSPVAVHADIAGLAPEGRYRFRLVAENKYGPSEGLATLFGPPVVTPRSALPILYTEATLRANVDPSGLATKYRFEYGKAAGEYDQSTPVGEIPAGANPTDVQAALTGLAEGVTYHFRVVAENEAQTLSGPDQTLVTLARRAAETCPNTEYRTGLSANLPDCRAYELVTPAETNGVTPDALGNGGTAGSGFNNWLTPPRGSAAGERVSYFTIGTLPGFEGNGLLDGYRAQRAPGEHPETGWSNESFGPTFREAGPDLLLQPSQQSVASDQLYSFWRIRPAESFPGTLAEGVYMRTPSGFEPLGKGTLASDLNAESRYLSPGGAHAIFNSSAHLEEEAAPAGTGTVYERAAGSDTARVVSIKPDGSSFGAGEAAGYVAATEDGTAIAFKVGGALYLHRGGQTTQVASGPNTFAGLSEDGRRVFYTATTAGEPTPATLFACDLQEGPCAGPGAHAPVQIGPSSIFVHVSAGGTRAFFTSETSLTGGEENEAGEKAEAAKRNLYAWDVESEATHFIAQLDPSDFDSFDGNVSIALDAWIHAINPGSTSGRNRSPTASSPDGGAFVFQSHAQLTTYDNEGHGEIYRYAPSSEAGERLTCVSCDPSGGPASGDALLTNSRGVHDTTVIANVTDDGEEVFFQSPDRLLPEDANDVQDVYEWRAKGADACERGGGCLALISSGQGEEDSYLYAMSADGDDVFFRTRERLVGQDVPGSPSIYDARVDGGIPDLPAAAPCQGDACQGNGAPPPALPAPTTRAGNNGNAEEPVSRCAKGKHRIKGRCIRKQQKPRKHKRHQHRANHDRRAHR